MTKSQPTYINRDSRACPFGGTDWQSVNNQRRLSMLYFPHPSDGDVLHLPFQRERWRVVNAIIEAELPHFHCAAQFPQNSLSVRVRFHFDLPIIAHRLFSISQ
jgi:hypothetical protein